jgi:hypothetical protein
MPHRGDQVGHEPGDGQLDGVARTLGLSDGMHAMLRQPRRSVEVAVPVQLESNSLPRQPPHPSEVAVGGVRMG